MSTAGSTGEKKAAGAFDVRNVIAALIGFYGVVLVVVGLVDDGEEALAKAGGVNANLWVGLAMHVVPADRLGARELASLLQAGSTGEADLDRGRDDAITDRGHGPARSAHSRENGFPPTLGSRVPACKPTCG